MTRKSVTEDGSACGGRQSFLAERDLRWLYVRINPFVAGFLLFLARIPFRVGFAQSQSSFLFHVRVNRDAERHDVERTLSLLEGLGIPTEECERALDLPIKAEAREEVTPPVAIAWVWILRGCWSDYIQDLFGPRSVGRRRVLRGL